MAEKGAAAPLLTKAIKDEDIDECMRLVEEEGADVHEKDEYGRSPIIKACFNKRLDIVEYLVSRGANIHDKDDNSNTC
jgi:ankyrin repeat protein